MAKRTFIQKSKPQPKSKDRHCLYCGTNISHRSPGVLFCCPHCKALYKEMEKLKANEPPSKPKLKTTEDFHTDAASVYYQEDFNKKSQLQKFNERYNKCNQQT